MDQGEQRITSVLFQTGSGLGISLRRQGKSPHYDLEVSLFFSRHGGGMGIGGGDAASAFLCQKLPRAGKAQGAYAKGSPWTAFVFFFLFKMSTG